MQNSKILDFTNLVKIKSNNKQEIINNDFKIYTPEIVQKYKSSFKLVKKITKNKDKTLYIMYEKVNRWYEKKENINVGLEKIHIKSKLGSYMSGGCGIGASLLANLTASGIFVYINSCIKKLSPIALICYAVMVTSFGITVLVKEDDEVEMYNIFLEVLEKLEIHKNDK